MTKRTLILLIVFSALWGLWNCNSSDSTAPVSTQPFPVEFEYVSTVHDEMTVQEFKSLITQDTNLTSIDQWVRGEYGVGDYLFAVKIEDQQGNTLHAGLFVTGTDSLLVIQHCDSLECVAALCTVDTSLDSVLWETPSGPIPVKKVALPFLLKLVDPDNPVGGSLAPLDTSLPEFDTEPIAGQQTSSPGLLNKTAAITDRKLRILSAFGGTWSYSPEFDEFNAKMTVPLFASATASHHFTSSMLDRELNTLRPQDVLIIYAHGARNRITKKMVGMCASYYTYLSEFYSVSRMKRQLDENPSGGPGIFFLAGCQTQDMVDQFDHPSRIILGFSESVYPINASSMFQDFMQNFASGLTLKESLALTNNQHSGGSVAITANASAPLNITLAQVGDFSREGCYSDCYSSKDGSCDDGGEGSNHTTCDYGHDCYDCGPREKQPLDASWKSRSVCYDVTEADFAQRWKVSLNANGINISGRISFHDCPGGGRLAYTVTGTITDFQAEAVTVNGTKTGGQGELYVNGPSSQQFSLRLNQAPSPNFTP